jgi:hypothetical protein
MKITELAKNFPNPIQLFDHLVKTDDKEIVDTFIATARASGIMSRRLVGAIDAVSTEPHSWAEYYDNTTNQWIQIDPILEKNTSIKYFPIQDLNHIVMAINGADDSFPYSVSFYKAPQANEPNSSIKDIEPFIMPIPIIKATIKQSLRQTNIILNNHAQNGIYNQVFDITSDGQKVFSFTIDRLPPLSEVIIPITLPKKYGKLSLVYKQTAVDIDIRSSNLTSPITIAASLAGISSVVAVITRRLLVSRRK